MLQVGENEALSNTSQQESSHQAVVFDRVTEDFAMKATFLAAMKSLKAPSIVLERLREMYVILDICEKFAWNGKWDKNASNTPPRKRFPCILSSIFIGLSKTKFHILEKIYTINSKVTIWK